jgi:DNA repair photolyase
MTTLDLGLNRVLEPRTSSPAQRLEAVAALTGAGVRTGVLVAPVIPGLTDHEIPAILEAAARAGASHASHIMLRLPLTVAPLFERWLVEHFPGRREKVMNRVRAVRHGRVYESDFETRHRGTGPFADQVERLFNVAARKFGLADSGCGLSTACFRRPGGRQMDLF